MVGCDKSTRLMQMSALEHCHAALRGEQSLETSWAWICGAVSFHARPIDMMFYNAFMDSIASAVSILEHIQQLEPILAERGASQGHALVHYFTSEGLKILKANEVEE